MTITESERMALCDIVLAYLQTPGEHPLLFHDVTRGVTTSADGLLTRLVQGDTWVLDTAPFGSTSPLDGR